MVSLWMPQNIQETKGKGYGRCSYGLVNLASVQIVSLRDGTGLPITGQRDSN
jgi:hypothetical protein